MLDAGVEMWISVESWRLDFSCKLEANWHKKLTTFALQTVFLWKSNLIRVTIYGVNYNFLITDKIYIYMVRIVLSIPEEERVSDYYVIHRLIYQVIGKEDNLLQITFFFLIMLQIFNELE